MKGIEMNIGLTHLISLLEIFASVAVTVFIGGWTLYARLSSKWEKRREEDQKNWEKRREEDQKNWEKRREEDQKNWEKLRKEDQVRWQWLFRRTDNKLEKILGRN
jgi:hypothetical protein